MANQKTHPIMCSCTQMTSRLCSRMMIARLINSKRTVRRLVIYICRRPRWSQVIHPSASAWSQAGILPRSYSRWSSRNRSLTIIAGDHPLLSIKMRVKRQWKVPETIIKIDLIRTVVTQWRCSRNWNKKQWWLVRKLGFPHARNLIRPRLKGWHRLLGRTLRAPTITMLASSRPPAHA